jgi:hypothetical protein
MSNNTAVVGPQENLRPLCVYQLGPRKTLRKLCAEICSETSSPARRRTCGSCACTDWRTRAGSRGCGGTTSRALARSALCRTARTTRPALKRWVHTQTIHMLPQHCSLRLPVKAALSLQQSWAAQGCQGLCAIPPSVQILQCPQMLQSELGLLIARVRENMVCAAIPNKLHAMEDDHRTAASASQPGGAC